jgi:hypothetical protein
MSVATWFTKLDDKNKHRGNGEVIVRNTIRRRIGIWYFEVFSSCGYRVPTRIRPGKSELHVPSGGFVSLQAWKGNPPLGTKPLLERRWQADSWEEAKSDINALTSMMQSESKKEVPLYICEAAPDLGFTVVNGVCVGVHS